MKTFRLRYKHEERVPVGRVSSKVGVQVLVHVRVFIHVHPLDCPAIVAALLPWKEAFQTQAGHIKKRNVFLNHLFLGCKKNERVHFFRLWCKTEFNSFSYGTCGVHQNPYEILVTLDSMQHSHIATSNSPTGHCPSLSAVLLGKSCSPWIWRGVFAHTWAGGGDNFVLIKL